MNTSEAIKIKSHEPGQKDIGEHTFNLPNILTFLRILMAPLYIVLFLEPTFERSIAAAGVFGVAALTDLLDGYIARQRGEITKIGRLLDPIADKILVISGLVLLVQFQRIGAWIAIILIVRDLAITVIRAIAASEGIIITPKILGKYKVVFQIIGILFLTLAGALTLPIIDLLVLGRFCLYVALGLSLISGCQYFIQVWQVFLIKGRIT